MIKPQIYMGGKGNGLTLWLRMTPQGKSLKNDRIEIHGLTKGLTLRLYDATGKIPEKRRHRDPRFHMAKGKYWSISSELILITTQVNTSSVSVHDLTI